MRPGDTVTAAALLFLVVVGWLRPISPRQRCQLTALALLGAALIAARLAVSTRFPLAASVTGDWLPCLLMLIVYWQAGRFFGKPHEKFQGWLVEFDRRWLGAFLDRWTHRWNTTWAGTYFELAYLLCYALIPCGVAVLYWTDHRSAVDQYWATVLPASYLCYLLVPFAQTLPPRLLPGSGCAPYAKSYTFRAMNLYILRHASIHLNTFPSAHVAATIGASLVLMRWVPVVGVLFLLISLSIAAGAVLGRYHYALDVILGAMLPLCIRGLLASPQLVALWNSAFHTLHAFLPVHP
jgi:membrane-associated phospholipid phosphatase